jgi:hypothetical protein
MKKNYRKGQYEKGIDNLFSSLSGFSLDNYLSNIYAEKVPGYFKKYLKPEKKYIENLAFELNDYVNRIQENLYENIRNNPSGAMKSSLEDLLFGNSKNKEAFCSKISETVEELSYATNILVAEGYKIWNVKYNTPGIGRVTINKLAGLTGQTDLPEFHETQQKIGELKNKTYDFLDYMGFDSENKIDSTEAANRYQEKMKSYGKYCDSRRLLAYDLESGRHKPLNASQEQEVFDKQVENDWVFSRGSKLEKMTESERNIDFEKFSRRKERQRRKDFAGHNYNSWWEKAIGYIGWFFGF